MKGDNNMRLGWQKRRKKAWTMWEEVHPSAPTVSPNWLHAHTRTQMMSVQFCCAHLSGKAAYLSGNFRQSFQDWGEILCFYGTTNTTGDGECVKQMCVQCRKGKTYFKVERTVIKREKQCSKKRKTPPGILTEWLQEELNMNTDRGQKRDGLVFLSLPAWNIRPAFILE